MTNRKKSTSIINVGVEVGKQFLDVCIHEKALHWQEENTPEGISSLLRRMAYYQVERLVMEATGRYEFNLATSGPPQRAAGLHRQASVGSSICRRHRPVSQNR